MFGESMDVLNNVLVQLGMIRIVFRFFTRL